jgi:hypothetical protein
MGKLVCMLSLGAAWDTFAEAATSGKDMVCEVVWCKSTAENIGAGWISVLKVGSGAAVDNVVVPS